ncbi:unnamed protein product [Rotaria sordida]|uniref:Proteasome activator complex subunit 4 n=1 Tax=Rotaria sordida TaxID=392033 RepID=A0A813VJQ6_9BILA|nr:unnamed protein product [Rotaria sordida]
MNDAEGHGLLTDHKGDKELTWYLYLFSELLRARGDTLIIYKQMIISVFHRCIQIIHKGSYKAVASAAKHLLKSLTHIHLINNRSTIENIDGPYVDFLPIRMWGQPVDVDKFQAQYYIPGDDELNFVREFVETFMYLELELLKEKSSKLSNEERLRSLTIVHHIATGCFRVVPRISSPNVQNLEPTVVPYSSQSQVQYSMYSKQPKFRENIRLRLLIDIGKLLDILVTSHSDDVSSIKIAHKIYSATSIYYGGSKHHVNELRKEFQANKLFIKNRLCSERQNPRFLIMKRIALQLEQFEIIEYATLTEIDKQVALKLFELSTNRYSEVRRQAQNELFSVLNRYRFSSQVLVDRIIELLNASGEVDHDQIKGCLYILLGNNNCFLPTEDSWATIEKLWPTLVRTPHASKISTQNLITDIKIHINKVFVTKEIIQNLNEKSIRAAAVLWHPLESNEMNTREVHNQANIQLYNRLMETLSSLLKDNILTWRQQETAMAFLCLLLQRQIPIPSSCIQTSVNLLVHDHSELRKYAAKSVAAICRLQKTPRIYVEKTLDKILQENQNNGSTVITHDECQPGDRDDNLWITIDNYKPPESQAEWEQTCFMDKTFLGYYAWPNIIKYPINKRAYYTQNDMPEQVAIIYNRFIDKNFIIQLTNLTALFRNFGLAFVNNFIEQVYVLIRDKTHEKQEGSHRVAAEIVAAIIRGSKYWTLEMLDELWTKLTPLLTEVCLNLDSETLRYWNTAFNCAMEHEDPRRMYRLVEFIRTLIDNQSSSNTFNETSRWSLIQTLRMFEWRIPSIWCDIYEHAKDLLDHSFKSVREHIATVLSMSFSFDVRLFNGDSKRHPNINQCMDVICDKLHRAIEIYEKTPLVNVYGQFVEIDAEACKALNVIETVILMHTNLFTWCRQPIKNGILRLFPYLCEIESVAANDPVFKRNLATSRMHVAMAYLHGNYLEILIEQLEEVCASPKWHARQAAIEFVQSMIFCNLFNARPYALRLHDLVLKCLFDERLEVRTVASTTLSGLYQCGYIQMIEHDLKYFRVMAKTKYLTKIDSTKVKSAKNIIKRHGGALGLCAIVLSSPYDIPTYLPEALMVLCEHSHDPDPIQKSIKQCLSEFRRTHYDSWHEHQEKFTERQLLLLADAFISRSYYA